MVENGDFYSLDSILSPSSLTAGVFTFWVSSENKKIITRYTLDGEFRGAVKIRARDLDARKNKLLIAGEKTLLYNTLTGDRRPIMWKEMERCALGKDSIWTYNEDTLYRFNDEGKFKSRKTVPGILDITWTSLGLVYIKNDSVHTVDTTLYVKNARRLAFYSNEIFVLADSVVVINLEK